MKIKYILILCFVFGIFSFVSADLLSINSGGDLGLIINPNNLIEGFFFSANNLPVVTNVILSSSSLGNTTNENLTVTFSSTDEDDDAITNITDWRVDGTSVAVLNMPFDTKRLNGEVRDYSSYGNNGTLGGGTQSAIPTWSSDCQVGGCHSFDGSDYVVLPDDLGYTTQVSAFVWFKKEGSPPGNYHIVFGGSQLEISITPSGEIRTGVVTSSRYVSNHGSGLLDGDWHYVGFTFNGTSKRSYIDGAFVGSQDPIPGTLDSSFSYRRIGRFGSSSTYYLNGSLDEVKVYDRALSTEQIALNYQEGLAGHSVETFVSQETDKGEVWQVAVTPNDHFGDGVTVLSNELEIINDAPLDPEPVLVSLNGRNESDTDLNCSTMIYDNDNPTNLDVDVNWLKDNVSQYNFTFTGYDSGSYFYTLLDNGNLTLGDFWKCSVRVYDQSDYSNWIDSNELEIIDITAPNITIISPEPINYTSLNVSYNVSLSETGSSCFYNLDLNGNVSMDQLNSTYFWANDSTLGPGDHEIYFYCVDPSGNWGFNSTNFTILNEAAISILMSDSLSWGVVWNLLSLPVEGLDAVGNNFNDSTDYYLNVSATNTLVDIYVKADGDLVNLALDTLGLGNETYAISLNDSNVTGMNKVTMKTNYVLIAEGIGTSMVYLKFYLDAPSTQPAGIYKNGLNFKAVRNGESI